MAKEDLRSPAALSKDINFIGVIFVTVIEKEK